MSDAAGGPMGKVIFVCVNYDGAQHTRRWLRSLQAQQGVAPSQIVPVVVDNASGPEDVAALEACCATDARVRLVRSERNVGYFAGLNVGLEAVEASENDLVVVGNNDLEFSPEFASTLLSRDYPDDVLVVAPDVITADGYHQNPHVPTRMSFRRKALLRLYFTAFLFARVLTFGSRALRRVRGPRKNPLADTSQYIHMGIGACYVLTPAFFRFFRRLEAPVFLYGEEALLAGQVGSAGGKTYYDAALHVVHAESGTLARYPSRVTYAFGKQSFPSYRKYL